ncbi:MAG: Zn-dependent hydrolase [Halarsenatibacteraceae bacterium]
MEINIDRLKENLINLGWIGFAGDKNKELPIGDKGITRMPYSRDYLEAEEFVKEQMEAAGLNIWKDPIGNLFGMLPGKDQNDEMIVTGSHIDTVIKGGLFDGTLGVLAAVESLRVLKESGYQNNHKLVAAVFNGEAGVKYPAYLGSRAFIGDNFTSDELSQLRAARLEEAELQGSAVDTERVKNFLELHIEQGQILENRKKAIGVVEGIVGISRYKAVMTGKANHAGTTPMELRDDALIKASRVILELEKTVKEINGDHGRMVVTVGQLEVEPGAVNVIPEKVEFSIEIRDMEKEKIDRVIKRIEGLEIKGLEIEEKYYEGSIYLDKGMQSEIAAAAESLGYDQMKILSGAGHHASPMSRVTPTGMIFVPSKDGISHSPDEWTDWQDVEKGANLLLETLKRLDNKN